METYRYLKAPELDNHVLECLQKKLQSRFYDKTLFQSHNKNSEKPNYFIFKNLYTKKSL